APLISNVEFNYALTKSTQIYAIALRKDVKNPFPPESDEVTITKEEGDAPKPPAAGPKPPADMNIDFDGLGARAVLVPIPAGNYGGLSAKNGAILFSSGGSFYYGRNADGPASLHIFTMKDRKDNVLAEGAGGYTLSDDGSKIMAFQQGGVFFFDATVGGD